MEQVKSLKELGQVEQLTRELEEKDLIVVAQTGYADKLEHQLCFVPARYKDCYLVHILNEISSTLSMVFTHTCKDTQRVVLMLGNLGVRAIPISGQMVQAERLAAVNMFKSGECNILVCSDVGSRGLDIPSVDTVINYTIPPIPEDYIHRVERTGFSILLVNQYEIVPYMEIERQHIGKTLLSCYAHEKEAMSLAERVKEANRLALKVSDSLNCV
ncbi:DEAD-box ATP-dependent RNA helicase 10 [Artemisia annua]|uniref:DEAD-box ATP-dependent RNA helicase 10 n=1 Tax=Artemisia annua TaxID=35608 RepID=A0A2U1NZY3_ARTAN|nr:DEAD-box ATP-dependent RNA helicase 10 [Artemisia annua]